MEQTNRVTLRDGRARLVSGDLLPELQLRPEDIRLIMHCRRQKWGEFTVKLKDGYPVMITRALQSIKLDQE
ncbi:MAG: hypothetical protein QHH27_05355 [Clostridia bacterium]|nr:hypothetical protein [Clostridia bacterium]MDH7572963.1 hypothetical protein [Clostridia bacterium]